MKFIKNNINILTLLFFIGSVIGFYFYSPPVPLNPESPKFLGKLIQMYFIFIIVFLAIFMTIRNLNPKHNIYLEIILSSVFIVMFAPQLMDNWTYQFNKIITSMTPTRLTNIILGSDQTQQIWPFAVILINSFIMYVRHKFSVKKGIEKAIGLKKLLIDCLALYGVLILLLWIQSHFSYVDAFFSYMTSETRFIHQIVKNNEDNPKYLEKFNVFYADDIPTIENEILDRYKFEGENIQKTIHSTFFGYMDIYLGKPNNKYDMLNWDNMKNFEDWVSFINNTNNKLITPNEMVVTKLMFPDRKLTKLELVRQGILYVKKAENKNGYFYYFTISDTFQMNKKHYLFTASFILFNIIMVFAIGYLYLHHKKKVFKKEKAEI